MRKGEGNGKIEVEDKRVELEVVLVMEKRESGKERQWKKGQGRGKLMDVIWMRNGGRGRTEKGMREQ